MAEREQLNEQERYRYIGFERFPKKVKNFWKSDQERDGYVSTLKEEIGRLYRNSVIYSAVMSASDRVVIALAGLVMVIAPFLVWMKVDTRYGAVSFTGLTGIFNLDSFWFYVELLEGSVIPLTVYLMTGFAYLSILFGALTLVFLFLKGQDEVSYLRRLKTIMRLQIIPCLAFLVIVILGLVGQRIPFGEHLGIYNLGGNYSIVTFITFSSFGFWLSLFGFVLNFNKSKDL